MTRRMQKKKKSIEYPSFFHAISFNGLKISVNNLLANKVERNVRAEAKNING